MGQFYITKTWLEDREIDLLKSYDFTEEVFEEEIEEDELYILGDLCSKGFLKRCDSSKGTYYLGAGGHPQHFAGTTS
jgi:hypothetical protein